jgi:hypothetical protein
MACWVGTSITASRVTSEAHTTTLMNHEVRISTVESNYKRLDEKLDKILDRLGGK